MFNRNTHLAARSTALLLALFSTSSALHAATIKVPAHQPSITAAISAAVNGDKIVVSEGVYYESLSAVLKTDVTIKAKGEVIVDAGGAANALSISLCTGLRVEGLTFTNATEDLIKINFGSKTVIEDCVFKASDSRGVMVNHGSDHEVVSSLFKNLTGTAVLFEADSSYVGDSKFIKCGQGNATPVIEMVGSFLTAEKNVIKDDGFGHGIAVGRNGEMTKNALVLGNEITGVGYDGIILDDAIACMVLDNVINAPGDDGIDLNSGADVNYLEGNKITAAGFTGIEVSSDSNNFSKNKIKKSGDDGAAIYGSATDDFWFKNRITKSGEYGIHIAGTGHSFVKNTAKKSGEFDLMDEADLYANDYLGNVFGTTGN